MHHQGIEENLRGYPNQIPKSLDETEKCPLPANAGFTKPKWYFILALGDTSQYCVTVLKKEGDTFRDWVILLPKVCDTFKVLYDTSSKGVWYCEVSHDKTPRGVRLFQGVHERILMGVQHNNVSPHAEKWSPKKRKKTLKDKWQTKIEFRTSTLGSTESTIQGVNTQTHYWKT